MKRIKYFSYYGCSDPTLKRDNSPAADSKIDYIIEVLNRSGYAVDHISHASSSTGHYIPGYVEKKGNNTLRYFPSFGNSSFFKRVLNKLTLRISFLIWCLLNLKKGEQVIVYHSLGYDSTFLRLKKLKKLRIIGDIEEIYQDVHPYNTKLCENEYKFIDYCDKLMYPNTILNERLNPTNRPYLVVHGIYKVNAKVTNGFDDDKIHILYAGTYDPVKGGAIASLRTAKFLSDKYHLHVTGFGTKPQEKAVLKEYQSVQKEAKCAITYHGFLNNEDFMHLMQSCHIGLCTQDPTSKLNLTSFPSKILNYMSNGLIVLSGRNRAIEESAVGDLLYYYDEQDPQAMAQAIMQIIQPNGEISKQRLRILDKQFEKELHTYIEQ